MPSKDNRSMHFTGESTCNTISGPSSSFIFPQSETSNKVKEHLLKSLPTKGFHCAISPFLKGKNTPSCYMLCDSGDLKLLCLSLSFKSCHQPILKECYKRICLRKVLKIKQSLERSKPIWWSADPQSEQTQRQQWRRCGCTVFSWKDQAHSPESHSLFCCPHSPCHPKSN